jgi:hypothetical protein
MPTPTLREVNRFEDLEQLARLNRGHWVDQAAALTEIKQSRRYREYGTFGAYVVERLGMSRPRAGQLLRAYAALANFKGHRRPPRLEALVRPLTMLNPADQVLAWNITLRRHGINPTHRQVYDVAAEVLRRRKR